MTDSPKKHRIAHVTTIDVSVRFLLLNQLLYLREEGYEVTAVCSPGPWLDDIRSQGIPVIPIKIERAVTPFSDLMALIRLYACFRHNRFDLIHTHTPKANLLGQLAAWLARTPIRVITVHGFYFHDGMSKWMRRFYIFLEKVSSKCAHWIFSQNREDMATAIRENICPESKMHYLGNGIDVGRFHKQNYVHGARDLREQLGIPPESPVIGTIGRLTFEKGYREFIQAAATTITKHPSTHFVIVGPDDVICKNELEALVAELKLQSKVHFCGMRLNVPDFYAMMACFALLSYREGMPRVLMEAAAMSLPAVATNIRGCREIIEPGNTGILVPARDADLAAKAILQILDDPAHATTMGMNARQRAEREFDERFVFERVHRGYCCLFGEDGGVAEKGEALKRQSAPWYSRFAKRTFDILFSLTGLVLASPLFLLIAILAKLGSNGTVFFRQVRPGFHGKLFTLLKFRTMTDRRDERGNLLPDRDRLTRMGRFLRSTSLDELPELVNVLKGEMSMVGPRPLLVQYLPLYSPEQNRRHEVKPGITGWAQVNGRNALTWEEKFRLDVWYVDHAAFFLDLRIVFKTVFKLITREGISAEGHVTMPEFRGSGLNQQ